MSVSQEVLTPADALSVTGAGGVELAVRVYGDSGKPELLFIHGLGQSQRCWDRQIDELARDHRIVTYDLRGHGQSGRPARVDAYNDGGLWADDLKRVMEATNLHNPILIGWSLGGYIIGQYLARYGAGHIRGINLVCAMTVMDPELLTEESLLYVGQIASPDATLRLAAIPKFLSLCFAVQPTPEAFELMLADNHAVPAEVNQGIVQVPGDGLDEGFAAVPHVLVTHGAKDALVRVGMSERILTLNPAARLSVYPEVGHSPFYEDARRFNEELAAFAKP